MPKFCPNCGTEISDKVKFCTECGADIDSFSVKKDSASLPQIKCFFNDCPDKTSRRFYCPLCGHDFCEKHKLHQVHYYTSQEKPIPPESKPIQPESSIPTDDERIFKRYNKSRFAGAFLIIIGILALAFIVLNFNLLTTGTVTTTPPLTAGCVTEINMVTTTIPTTIPTIIKPIAPPIPIQQYVTVPIQQYVTVPAPKYTIYQTTTPTSIFYPRPMTGTIVTGNNMYGGEGEFTIDNKRGSSDVVSILTYQNSKTTRFAVFIRKGESYTIYQVNDGIYDLYVLSGGNWNLNNKQFDTNPNRIKFDDSFPFITSRTSGTTWEVTIYPVIDGNAKTKPISQDDFPRL